MKHILNGICVVLGLISIGIGCIGIVLPVLPTTPFLLLALLLFAKGSKRFHQWFQSTRIYKKYLEDFVVNRSMTRAAKFKIMAMVTIIIIIGFYFSPILAKVILAAILIFHYAYFLLRIKTIKEKGKHADTQEISS